MDGESREIRSRIPGGNRAFVPGNRSAAVIPGEGVILSGLDAGTGSTGTSAGERRQHGQSFAAINDLTSEVLVALSSRLDAHTSRMSQMESSLIGRIDSLEAGLVGKIHSEAGRILRARGGDGSRDSGCKFSKKKPVHAEHLEDCLKDEENHAVVPLVTWTMIITAISFAVRTGKAKEWIGRDMYECMSTDLPFIGTESGLSAILFSVNGQKRETKENFRRPEGRLWSYMIRNSIASLFNYSASHLFATKSARTGEFVCRQPGRAGPIVPSWLLKLHPRENCLELVTQVVAKLEKTDDQTRSSRVADSSSDVALKKRKLNSDDSCSIHAVKQTRKVLVDKLSYGRCSGREYLHNNLLFVVDKICYDFESVLDAKDAGYSIEFVEFGFDAEGNRQENPADVWSVGDANTDTLKKARLHSRPPQYTTKDDENIAAIAMLISDHPWLSVKLVYKLKVRCPANCTTIRRGEPQPELFFDKEEWLPLHNVALGFYMELFKKEDPKFLLSCSNFSIKAVHALAIALRGAIRNVLGLEVSDTEEAALGNVEVFPEASEDEDDDIDGNSSERTEREGTGCLSIARKISKPGKDRSGYEKPRDSLFVMPWTRYVEAQRARDEYQRRRTESSISERELMLDEEGTDGFDLAAF